MNPKYLACVLALLLVISGPAFADKGKYKHGKGRGDIHQRHKENHRHHDHSYFHKHGYVRLDIPKGHYPAPGKCRVWYPGRSPGKQPSPVKCGRASAPPGAWLIHRPKHSRHVHVTVYEPKYERKRRDKVRAVGEFEIGSGMLVRVLLK